ncbi:39S ribosomal protein L9, mitochondrial [Synchiropus splendidus]|uniref:39S ribosomal protein L9, mitochondrial n=1 Tax=Synchiropus splendidus TaxID=270530 RepID=UPI00237E21FD|nr:39S ribosomal protein L9, mitochondrial [Synchiropus splendidus]
MWGSGRRVLQGLLVQSAVRSFTRTPAQNTVIVERCWQVPLSKVGSPPRLYPRRHRIYKLVEDTKQNPKQKMELILTQTVPKLGGRGETVFVKKSVGRNKLLANGLAVYPSPENKAMFAEELRILREGKLEERVQTRTGLQTVEFLKKCKLTINKMPSEDFQLNLEVVRRQLLKKLGLVAPPHAVKLPFEPITEEGDYWCEVTVNGINTVRIPMSLVPYEDQSAKYQRMKKAKRQQDAAEGLCVDQDPVRDASSDSNLAQALEQTTSPSPDTMLPPSDEPKKE